MAVPEAKTKPDTRGVDVVCQGKIYMPDGTEAEFTLRVDEAARQIPASGMLPGAIVASLATGLRARFGHRIKAE